MIVEDEGKAAAALIEFIAKGIVNEPGDVKVVACEGGSLLELETNESDRGRVIGRQGRIAKSMRAILSSSNTGSDCRLEIVD
jgi:predicted RNA-binding protein YlqC (UPF0109 family)